MPWETPKTNWTPSDPVGAGDMNRIEGNAAQLKSDLDAHAQATAGVHGATSAATPNTIVQRDANGRAKVAAPSANDDIARKAEVDAAEANAKSYADATFLPKSGGVMTGELTFQDDGEGVTFYQGGRIYKRSGSGITIRRHSGDVDPEVENNAGTQRWKIWHAGNDGAGSGLDADLLDGLHASNFWTKSEIPYETGTWTPELRFGESTAGITYASRRGRYTRIANVVYWNFEITLSSKGSASGTATIAGLPFSNVSGIDIYHAVGRAGNISVPSGQWLSSFIVNTTVYLVTNTGSYISSAEFANNSILRASGFYFI